METVWFVTGVSSGLGTEIALKALEAGQHVVGTVRNHSKAADKVAAIEKKGGNIMELDVTNAEACFAVFKKAESMYGHIDVLVNNAGYSLLGAVEDLGYVTLVLPFQDLWNLLALIHHKLDLASLTAALVSRDEEAKTQMETNFFGPHRLIRAALPGFRARKNGAIVNITSVAGIDGLPSCGLYAASKFALEGMPCSLKPPLLIHLTDKLGSFFIGLSESLARETEPFNVNVLIVEPGAFRTNFLSGIALPSKPHTEDYKTVKAVLDKFDTMAGRQKGDPTKAAARIYEAVSGQGLAGDLKGRVLRMPLGEDCIERYEVKIKTMKEDLEAVRTVAMSTSF